MRPWLLVDALATCLHDRRDPDRIQHGLRELLAQRVYGMAGGYEDCNDSARLASDPMQRLLLNRDPVQVRPWPRSPRRRGLKTGWMRAP
ncbi:MAG: transposase [Rhodanobacteraceae bacterium]